MVGGVAQRLRRLRALAAVGDPRLLMVFKICMVALASTFVLLALVAAGYALVLQQVAATVQKVSLPSVKVLSGAMQERNVGMLELQQPGQRREQLLQVRAQTDTALANMRREADDMLLNELTPGLVEQRTAELNAALAELPRMRARADAGQASSQELYEYYNELINRGSTLFGAQADEASDRRAGQGGRVATELFVAADRDSRAAAMIALAIQTGRLSQHDYREITDQRAAALAATETLIPRSTPAVQQNHAALTRSPAWNELREAANIVAENGAWGGQSRDDRAPSQLPDSDRWSQISNEVTTEAVDLAVSQSSWAAELGASNADRDLWLALGGCVVIAVVAFGIARGTSYNVRIANRNAHIAEERAQHVQLIRSGHQRVSEKNARELGPLTRSTIKRVNELALERGDDEGLVDVCYAVLKDLMRIRRVAQNEAILAGGIKASLGSRAPVALEEALHAARADTSNPQGVEVATFIPGGMLRPALAEDVISSVFELMENALLHGEGEAVSVISRPWGGGINVIIEDSGKGMSPQQFQEYNEVLLNPPGLEWHTQGETAHRGLYQVAHFTREHGIHAQLTESALGGVRAVLRFNHEHFVPSNSQSAPRGPRVGQADDTALGSQGQTDAPAGQPTPAGPGPSATPHTRFTGYLTTDGAPTHPGSERPRHALSQEGNPRASDLPKRRPRASLAEGLRDPTAHQEPEPTVALSAEGARNTTAAIRRGSRRARDPKEN